MAFSRELSATSLYVLHLMSAALRGVEARGIPEGVSWERVYRLALSNSVATICAFAAGDESQPWRAEVDKNLYRLVSFDVQRSQIFAAMEQAGLSYLPLKGAAIGGLYPRPEMRWMCDNDILYGFVEPSGPGFAARNVDGAMAEMRRIMEGLGFKTVHMGMGNHESFEKQPFFNFEMHRGLANPEVSWWRYYENPWQHAKLVPGSGHEYEFSREDVYLFHIAHACKHFQGSGCGVRCVADEWVLLNAWGDGLDWPYIEGELRKLGMEDFERRLKRLAQLALQDDACGRALAGDADALPAECEAMLAFMLGSGTYGTVEGRVANALSTDDVHGSKGRYMLQRVFPSLEKLRQGYPILKKHPWLVPCVYAYRLVVKPFTNTRTLVAEWRALKGYSRDGGENE